MPNILQFDDAEEFRWRRVACSRLPRNNEPHSMDSTSFAAPDLARKVSFRILVVDDDPEVAQSIRLALRNQGYEVLIARDGNQGLAIAETERPDLVVLDLMMPKRSGFLVLEKLRENETTPPRVIVITANEGERHQDYAELLGVDEYIRKPFPMERLLECVRRLLTKEAK
jgi:DNA-binding response OmpR family regulator